MNQMINRLILIFSFTALVLGCKKENQEISVSDKKDGFLLNSLSKTNDVELVTTSAITEDFINFYVDNKSFNFYTSLINDIVQTVGEEIDNTVFSKDSNGEIFLEQKIYDGFELIYNVSTGKLFNVIINKSNVSVEREGCVGKSRNDIQSLYPEGFYKTNDGINNLSCYYVMVLNLTKEQGTGYRFYFSSSDIVDTIVISSWSFAP